MRVGIVRTKRPVRRGWKVETKESRQGDPPLISEVERAWSSKGKVSGGKGAVSTGTGEKKRLVTAPPVD